MNNQKEKKIHVGAFQCNKCKCVVISEKKMRLFESIEDIYKFLEHSDIHFSDDQLCDICQKAEDNKIKQAKEFLIRQLDDNSPYNESFFIGIFEQYLKPQHNQDDKIINRSDLGKFEKDLECLCEEGFKEVSSGHPDISAYQCLNCGIISYIA